MKFTGTKPVIRSGLNVDRLRSLGGGAGINFLHSPYDYVVVIKTVGYYCVTMCDVTVVACWCQWKLISSVAYVPFARKTFASTPRDVG